MSLPRNASTLAALIFLVVTGAFVAWYGSWGRALSPEEIDDFARVLVAAGPPLTDFLDPAETRRFLESDDGGSFYVVNVFRLRERAAYEAAVEEGLHAGSTGQQALKQFSRQAVPIWLRRASHPVFVSRVSQDPSSPWQLVTVVRFRSRRDWIAMVSSDDFAAALPHRLAATEANVRLSLSGTLVPSPVLLLLIGGVGLLLLVRLAEIRAPANSP
jgi:hypothetical protein